MGPRAGLDAVAKKKKNFVFRESNPGCPVWIAVIVMNYEFKSFVNVVRDRFVTAQRKSANYAGS
jgi:hypothetical protein